MGNRRRTKTIASLVYNTVKPNPQEDLDLRFSPFFHLIDFNTYFLKESSRLHQCKENEPKTKRFKEILETFKSQNVLVISHYNVIKSITNQSVNRYELVKS